MVRDGLLKKYTCSKYSSTVNIMATMHVIYKSIYCRAILSRIKHQAIGVMLAKTVRISFSVGRRYVSKNEEQRHKMIKSMSHLPD